MAINFAKQSVSGSSPKIWRGECKMLPGGFKPVQTFAIGTLLQRGTPIFINFDEMSAAVVKVAKVLSGGTTSKPRVAKGSLFAVGDVLMKIGSAKVSQTISSIDSSNDSYDVLNLSGAIAGLAANDIIQESTAYVAADSPNNIEEKEAEPKYIPNAIVGEDKEFNGKGIPAIDAAYEAVVLYKNVEYPVRAEWLEGICLKSNPNILFINQ